MALEMKVPSLGESITEVEIARWLVEDGDYVEKDQAIAEIDSDKATLELPAEEAGKITLKAAEGDLVKVGAVVCLIDTKAERPEGSPKSEVGSPKMALSEASLLEERDREVMGLREKSVDENAEFTFSEWLKHLPSGDKTSKANESSRKIKLDLIDKFIQEDPRIKPKKTEFYSPVNMARLSVVDDSPLVSETLALIQVEQGSYEEAIKTYQKLSLKNPEKRSYFANQIKILNQKIK